MRRSIARDFAACPGVRVVMMLDERLPMESHPGVETRVVADGEENVLESLAAEVDYTLVIAPETGEVLALLAGEVAKSGGRSLGSPPRAITMTGDKARLAHHFEVSDIPTPKTWMINLSTRELPTGWDGPVVVKPRVGAGSVDTVVVRDRRCPNWVTSHQMALAQPYLAGRPMSASFLVDVVGRPMLLGIGRQRIDIDEEGRISYHGGIILSEINECPKVVEMAINSVNDYLGVKGLRGFVGVDYLDDPEGGITVLEINPRPTTSYVGLATMFGPGMIASAWLDAMQGPLDQTDWPDRLHSLRQGSDVSFDADGTIVSEDRPR
jgi:tyramine---L-glutamate ligase